jgi:hypothetical protein
VFCAKISLSHYGRETEKTRRLFSTGARGVLFFEGTIWEVPACQVLQPQVRSCLLFMAQGVFRARHKKFSQRNPLNDRALFSVKEPLAGHITPLLAPPLHNHNIHPSSIRLGYHIRDSRLSVRPLSSSHRHTSPARGSHGHRE